MRPFKFNLLFLAVASALAFLLFGCAPRVVRVPVYSGCDDEVRGACVVYAGPSRPVPHARLERAFMAAAKYWDTKPDALDGWTVVFHGTTPLRDWRYWGVTVPELKRVEVALERAECPELVFVHEWGHASAPLERYRPHMAYAPDDPRFEDARILSEALAGFPGCSP